MTLAPGTLLNRRYRIIEVIAHGGMGAIYRAADESLRVEVAVKENLILTEENSRQFHREATILAGLRHAHLPRVTDHFALGAQGQYLVMDYIPGEDLRGRISREGRLPEAEVLRIGIAIADAVAYLHRHDPPILHRDIKPGNIKITPAGQVYLVDFGLAKMAQAGQQTTIGAQSLTPGYAPPEQYAQGTDQRSDIYALAATLYAALTGAVPEDALTRAMGSAVLTPVRARSPQVSEGTVAVVERAMSVDPRQRYQTAGEFQQALQAAAAPGAPDPTVIGRQPSLQPTIRGPEGSPAGASRPTARPSRWLAFGLVGVLLLGGLAGFGFLASRLLPGADRSAPTQEPTQPPLLEASPTATARPTQTPSPIPDTPTPPPAPTATQPPPADTLEPTLPPAPIATPLGGGPGQLAFASNRDGTMQIWVMNADGSAAQQVTQMQDGACQPDWSPDGLRLVFVSPCRARQEEYQGSSLFIINLDGSGLVSLATTPGGDFDPAWSPDGEKIAFASLRDGRTHIYLYYLADNKVTRLSPAPVYDRQPAWSPDGKLIAFVTSRAGHEQIWTMAADGSAQHEFSLFDRGQAAMPAWSRNGQVILFSQGNPTGLVAKQVGDRVHEFPIATQVRPVYDARVSSDGQWVAFEGSDGGKRGIFIMTATGTNVTRLIGGESLDIQPVWRP